MGHRNNYQTKKRKFRGNRYTVAEQSTPVDSPSDNKTASSSKLEGNQEVFRVENSDINEICGHRIVDIDILISVFAVLCCPVCFNEKLSLIEDSQFGLCSNFLLKCNKCSFTKGFASSKKVNNENEINILVVYALRLIGKGYTAGKKLFSMLDMPFISRATFRRQELKILQAASKAAEESMDNAAKEVKQLKA